MLEVKFILKFSNHFGKCVRCMCQCKSAASGQMRTQALMDQIAIKMLSVLDIQYTYY